MRKVLFTIFLLVLFSCATCPNCSLEKKWLLEDAWIHTSFVRWGRSGYDQSLTPRQHVAFAERFTRIAKYIDGGNVDESQLEADILFLRNCLYFHVARNNPPNRWDTMWIERYRRIIKKLEERRKQ